MMTGASKTLSFLEHVVPKTQCHSPFEEARGFRRWMKHHALAGKELFRESRFETPVTQSTSAVHLTHSLPRCATGHRASLAVIPQQSQVPVRSVGTLFTLQLYNAIPGTGTTVNDLTRVWTIVPVVRSPCNT